MLHHNTQTLKALKSSAFLFKKGLVYKNIIHNKLFFNKLKVKHHLYRYIYHLLNNQIPKQL